MVSWGIHIWKVIFSKAVSCRVHEERYMFRTHPTYLFHTSQPHRLPNTECEEVNWTPKPYIQKTFSPQQTGWFQVAQVFDDRFRGFRTHGLPPAAWPGRKRSAFRTQFEVTPSCVVPRPKQLQRSMNVSDKIFGSSGRCMIFNDKDMFFKKFLNMFCLFIGCLGFPHIKIMTAVALLIYVQKWRWILRLGRLIFVNFVTSSRTRECYIWYIYIYMFIISQILNAWYVYLHLPWKLSTCR